ncbi:fumarylacetoacetate hydrolase family protein [Paenibacillus sp. WLX1005]|uniref:fumarylacetoacetate hydrolase family protein n=1 Tax=Paenibacillus sp. WLX1005 TaxID=3243766 RepID=UPI0039842B0A
MKLATIQVNGKEQAAWVHEEKYILLEDVNKAWDQQWETEMFELITSGQWEQLTQLLTNDEQRQRLAQLPALASDEVVHAPLYRHPRKIWGIGMNYVQDIAELKQGDLDEEPVSFMKPDTTIIGPENEIELPSQSEKVTAEAELALIIGKVCRHVTEEEAPHYVAGFCTAIDVTAADIHARHPRFLARAKSFDTFFGFGSQLITPDEVEDVLSLTVQTHHNGELVHENKTDHMKFQPWYIVSFLSQVMTLLPGDVIMTGTPGAVVLRDGDTVGCSILDHNGQLLLEHLRNGVIDGK